MNLEVVNLNNLEKFEQNKSKSYLILSTPKQFLKIYKDGKLQKEDILSLVIEELDYCLSFGYEQDLT